MVQVEDLDCRVCFEHFSRRECIPRMLFCKHTFCDPCLEKIAQREKDKLSIQCPLCRQVSVVSQNIAVKDVLYVNSHIWDRILEDHKAEEVEESTIPHEASPTQPQCRPRPSSKYSHLRLRLRAVLRRMTASRESEERIVTECNVQMKSWRRLSREETS